MGMNLLDLPTIARRSSFIETWFPVLTALIDDGTGRGLPTYVRKGDVFVLREGIDSPQQYVEHFGQEGPYTINRFMCWRCGRVTVYPECKNGPNRAIDARFIQKYLS